MKNILYFFASAILLIILPISLSSCFTAETTSSTAETSTTESSTIEKEEFENDYNEIVEMLKKHNSNIEYCADANILIMNFCINELNSISKFSTVHRVFCLCDEEEDFERFYGDDADVARYFVSSVFAGNSEAYHGDKAKWQTALNICAVYNKYRLGYSDLEEEITQKLTDLRENYGSKYSYEIGLLNDWFIESKVFSESMFDFNKSKIQYQSDLNSFKNTLLRLSAKADLNS